ncbi:hypothetical protein VP01_192g7 [Puccinia sorghi]|uniref:Uncharacterized protein n=1 Tax=Puccinia sorghi TaxID=27349 RepID=A0A0L6VCE3_9BASI|nr:hypothetical protein VP01_192g7 [Puccinia sorghi]
MLPRMYSKALMALVTTLAVLVTVSSSASTCGDWYQKNLLQGKKLRIRAELVRALMIIKRDPFQGPGRIKSSNSPFQVRPAVRRRHSYEKRLGIADAARLTVTTLHMTNQTYMQIDRPVAWHRDWECGKTHPCGCEFCQRHQVCGRTYLDTDRGACLWDGSNRKTPRPSGLAPGWLSKYVLPLCCQHRENCGRQIFMNRKNVRAEGRILDSCTFAGAKPLTVEQGCSTMYVTLQTQMIQG